ncbi:MAG: biopolymer transporter ExbD [Halobacteriovoraceae bacterium]|nr:biopolymer transporter ExbD [Halobacteriovoraceae bacterium]
MAIHLGDDEDEIVTDINMTPLIDIMLVLLILFMVTSSIALESGLDVDLPKISGKTEKKEASAIIVSLDKDGKLYVQGSLAEMNNLETTLKDTMAKEKTGLVILEGDQKSRLGIAVQVMDIAKAAGATKFAIAADAGEGN